MECELDMKFTRTTERLVFFRTLIATGIYYSDDYWQQRKLSQHLRGIGCNRNTHYLSLLFLNQYDLWNTGCTAPGEHPMYNLFLCHCSRLHVHSCCCVFGCSIFCDQSNLLKPFLALPSENVGLPVQCAEHTIFINFSPISQANTINIRNK